MRCRICSPPLCRCSRSAAASRCASARYGPLSAAEYAARGEAHCVAGTKLPYGASTYAWELREPVLFREPVSYQHRHGCVIWARKE